MIKYLSILYIVFLSFFLLEFSFSGIGHSKVSQDVFPFNLKNSLSNSILNSFVSAIDSKAKLIDDMPQRNDTNTFSTMGLLSSVLFPDNEMNGSFNSEKNDTFENGQGSAVAGPADFCLRPHSISRRKTAGCPELMN